MSSLSYLMSMLYTFVSASTTVIIWGTLLLFVLLCTSSYFFILFILLLLSAIVVVVGSKHVYDCAQRHTYEKPLLDGVGITGA